ncbi:hypothetical protein OE09_2616 [Flavobacteriaceae bacterium MAR_2010_72]|nr:hypothetical protein OE09_2616 [Flavobacteriaceae bacterium MAR_2010_72]TVZ58682.1 hypothetical protein NA63_1188 [Flavobacteriaceae bacterium MAR_2010_105]
MKKLLLSLALLFALAISFTSCRETKEKTIIIEENQTEGALEKAGKAVDEAVEETKEAGEAIEKAAEEIGDDN